MFDNFEGLTEEQQDELARERIREILAKPKPLTEKDIETVAGCVAFIGTSQKMADEFATRLLQVAEALIKGVCPRCGELTREGATAHIYRPVGETPKRTWTGCTICVTIRNVEEKKVKPWTKTETAKLKAIYRTLSSMDLLAAFPDRTWGSISSRLYRLGLK